MGVHCAYIWQPAAGQTAEAAYEGLCHSLLVKLKGSHRGKWNVQMQASTVQASGPNQGRADMVMVAFSEKPDRLFAVALQAKQVLEADLGARALIEQEQSMRRLATVVLEGPIIHLGDFVVRLALPAQRPGAEQLSRFLLVTVEYLPLLSWHAAQPVLQDFAAVLDQTMHDQILSSNKLRKVDIEWTSFDLSKEHGLQHLALQLSHHIMRLCRP